jgi:hypothetical protein
MNVFSYIYEGHQIAPSHDSTKGAFWHAILHRQEPDAGKGGALDFSALRERAAALGVDWVQPARVGDSVYGLARIAVAYAVPAMK